MISALTKWLPYGAILLVYAAGANLDVMEVDAAQYAHIALEMLLSGDFLHVFERHENYLDKPPLLFWTSALSMKIFGIGNWQYKLPSILFSLLGIFSTFKLGERLYSTRVGHHSAMILGGSFAMIMINNDIKTDTILVSSITFSIWMLVSYLHTDQWKFIIGAAIGIAAAMLAKGPIGLVMPVLAIGGHIVLKRDWRSLIDPKWLVLLLLVAFLLVPMCIGLFQQHGPDGLKFYFWTQSFGRVTGESTWQNNTTPLFFTHVFLWSFLPWTLLGIAALLAELKNLPKRISQDGSELFLVSGIVLVWVALSLSRFKLPHYIFVVYPLMAILAATYVNGLKNFSRWAWAQLILAGLSILLLVFILRFCFPLGGWVLPVALVLMLVGAILYFTMSYRSSQVIVPTFILSIGIGLGLNLHFYPQLLPYQANAVVGLWVSENDVPEQNFIGFSTGGRALDFYAQRVVPWTADAEQTISRIEPGIIVYASKARYDDLKKYNVLPKDEIVFENFEVQKLTIQFLNPKTRDLAVKKNYLLFY